MKIICRLLLAMACLCLANISWATVCANSTGVAEDEHGNDSNLLIVFYVQIMPDDFVMQLHRF